jgi:hypothetical protein
MVSFTCRYFPLSAMELQKNLRFSISIEKSNALLRFFATIRCCFRGKMRAVRFYLVSVVNKIYSARPSEWGGQLNSH